MNKKMKYILVTIVAFLIFNLDSDALTYGGCEYSEISRLKSIVSNVNISYDYYIRNNQVYFNVTINNITPGIYFVDSQTGLKYEYSNTVDGEITINDYKNTTGHYKFYSGLSECYGVKLSNKYYTLPTYNSYYGDPLCEDNKNYSLCQKWAKITYSYSEFEKLIYDYNNKEQVLPKEDEIKPIYQQTYLDIFAKFYIKYYYFILIGIIFICVTVMIISKKKNSFDL